jgi:hypothetical protein
MSLLYECINGIIQGGVLGEAEGTQEGDEIASLCVTKLRGMVVMDADPNRTRHPFTQVMCISNLIKQSSMSRFLHSIALRYRTPSS